MPDNPIPAEIALDEEPFTDDELTDALVGESRVNGVEPGPSVVDHGPVLAWRIENDGAAEWAMRKWTEAAQALKDLDAQAARWRVQIDQWLVTRTRRVRATEEFFRRHLKRYAVEVRDSTGVKTLVLPSGRVSTRPAGGNVRMVASDAFVRWAAASAPELLDYSPRPDMEKLRERAVVVDRNGTGVVMIDGEVVAGVEVDPPRISATVYAS